MTHGAIASNIVNGQTPNYHRVDVDFKEALAQASGDPATSDELTLSTDNPADFGAATPGEFSPSTVTDETSKMRADGNNVRSRSRDGKTFHERRLRFNVDAIFKKPICDVTARL